MRTEESSCGAWTEFLSPPFLVYSFWYLHVYLEYHRASNQFHMKKIRGALFEHDIRAAVSGRVVRKRSSFFILLLPSLFLENKMNGDQCISLLPLHIEGGEVAKSSLVW